MEINLILTLSYSIPDVLCCGGSGACPSPLVRQICNSFYYVSIFQIISYLTTSPTHTWKSTLYLPFPIPFLSGACPSPLVRQICTFLLCKYLSNYFLLNHFTHPHMEINLILTLSYSIPDVLCCGGSGACPSPLVRQICNSFYYVSIFQIISYLTTSPTHTWKSTLYLPFPIPFQMYFVVAGPAHAPRR